MEDVPDRARCLPFTGWVKSGGLGRAVDDSKGSRLSRASGGGASIERRRGRLSGRPRDRATGRERPRTASEERMPGESRSAKDRVKVSPRLESAWGAVKRAMHPSAQPAKVGWACGGRRKTIVQQRIELRSRRPRGRLRGCPFRRCRWQTPVARTSGRVVPMAKAVGTALRC
jgi:hypothetical protein